VILAKHAGFLPGSPPWVTLHPPRSPVAFISSRHLRTAPHQLHSPRVVALLAQWAAALLAPWAHQRPHPVPCAHSSQSEQWPT
jgi:hypothetical protein